MGTIMALATQEISREAWRVYFDELTAVLGAVEATTEVVGHDLGAQVADERLLLTDITYDDRDDVITVVLASPDAAANRVEHLIEHPQHVLVATEEPPLLGMTLDIQDGELHQWLIRLVRPPALPAG